MDLLVFDIGNTSIKMGVCHGSGASIAVEASFVFPTPANATADSMGLEISAALRHAGKDAVHWDACVAASVVPAINPALSGAARRYLGIDCLFAGEDLAIPLENRYARPSEVGADLLVGAYAARKLLPDTESLIVVDYGTAATFVCVNGNAYLGGLIFPGPATAASALALKTAKLPHISLEDTACEPIYGRDTATCIRHGLLFGYVSVTEGLCRRLTRQLPSPVKIVATGGFAKTIAKLADSFDLVAPDLLLAGLATLYMEQNR